MAKKFKEFNLPEAKRARAELMNRFSVEAKKLGLEINLGHITYGGDNIRCKLTATIINKNPVTPTATAFVPKTRTPKTDVPKVGQTFLNRGTVFTITRFKWNNPKYPVIAQNARGTTYKWSLDQVHEGS